MRTLSIATGFLPHVLEEASNKRLLIVGPHAERVRELFHNAAEHELRLERYLQVVADGRIKFEMNVSDQGTGGALGYDVKSVSPAPPAVLIFDLDDTLVDTSAIFYAARESFVAFMREKRAPESLTREVRPTSRIGTWRGSATSPSAASCRCAKPTSTSPNGASSFPPRPTCGELPRSAARACTRCRNRCRMPRDCWHGALRDFVSPW